MKEKKLTEFCVFCLPNHLPIHKNGPMQRHLFSRFEIYTLCLKFNKDTAEI
jgi:hypothetical protein